VVLCNVWGVEFGQNRDFLYNIFNFVFGIFDVDDLDSDSLPSTFVDSRSKLATIQLYLR
jgi:hypothetical protein